MPSQLQAYKSRNIEFVELVNLNTWQIKVYSITTKNQFQSHAILDNAIAHLKKWLPKKSILKTHDCAFLIVHEGKDGIWILINWWTDSVMLETEVYFTDYSAPEQITKSIYKPKQLICIWELEVVIHERKAWIEHVLKKATNPDFKNYLNDYLIQ